MSIDQFRKLEYMDEWNVLCDFNWRDVSKLDRLIRIFNGICQNCGIKTNKNDYSVVEFFLHPIKDKIIINKNLGGSYPTVEHKIPQCMGGDNNPNNLTLLCNDCNWNLGKLLEYYFRKWIRRSTSNIKHIPTNEFQGKRKYRPRR